MQEASEKYISMVRTSQDVMYKPVTFTKNFTENQEAICVFGDNIILRNTYNAKLR